MDPFTVLDVVSYENYRTHDQDITPSNVMDYFINKVIRHTTDKSTIKNSQHLSHWFYMNYDRKQKFETSDINIPFKITEGYWKPEEFDWYIKEVEKRIVSTRIMPWLFGGLEVKKLANPKEMFYVFCELLRHKFRNDEYLILIMDDILKRYIYLK